MTFDKKKIPLDPRCTYCGKNKDRDSFRHISNNGHIGICNNCWLGLSVNKTPLANYWKHDGVK